MKIICKDNFDRENIADTVVCENINEYYGELIVDFLNKKGGENSPDYYKLVENNYRLWKGMEEFV